MAREAAGSTPKKLLIAGPSAKLIARLRGGLIKDCFARGIAVRVIAPEMRAEDAQGLIAMGAEAGSFALRPAKFSLLPERKAIAELAGAIKAWQPDAVLAFGSSVAPFAVRAAKRARVQRIALMVSELTGRKVGKDVARAAKLADIIIAHNREDAQILSALICGADNKVITVPGAGADLAAFENIPLPALAAPLVFVASARLDKVKGILEYLEAARQVRAATDQVRFILTGPEGAGSDAIQTDVLSRYANSVAYTGDAADLRDVLRDAHVFVSPSHLEGMPHAVLQAMAAGRPVVATDIAGTRDAVDEMINGTLVSPGSAESLAEGFRRMLKHLELWPAMGRASRAKAERLFPMTVVNAKILEVLKLP